MCTISFFVSELDMKLDLAKKEFYGSLSREVNYTNNDTTICTIYSSLNFASTNQDLTWATDGNDCEVYDNQ